MGMDFVALMKYPGPDERLARVLDRLEAESPEEVRAFGQPMRGRFGPGEREGAGWEFTTRPELRDQRLGRRPRLPNLQVALWLPEDFRLTFGPDAVEIYHLLRWQFFLTDPDLQRAMLDACRRLGRLIAATDCIVTNDCSSVIQAFESGAGFDASLAAEEPEEGERATLGELYLEIPEARVVRTVERPGRSPQEESMDWDLDRPVPEGWERSSTWDSQGYWRLEPGPGEPEDITAVDGPANAIGRDDRKATEVSDEIWWAACSDPVAMIDHVLKQDEVDWRKVRLWACACVRRAWPRLKNAPERRVVEVSERFANGAADWREVEIARAQVLAAKRGDPRGHRAAWCLSILGSKTIQFPVADISDAVVKATVDDDPSEAATAERRVHADLLRDIFGPRPTEPVALQLPALNPCILTLARATYQKRELPVGRLDPSFVGVLADALEEGGAPAEWVAHLRGTTAHYLGCWVLDLLLSPDVREEMRPDRQLGGSLPHS